MTYLTCQCRCCFFPNLPGSSRNMDHSSQRQQQQQQPPTGNPRKVRTQVTEWQLTSLVALLVAPQLILQVLAVTLQPLHQSISFNDEESVGRVVCEPRNDDLAIGQRIATYGYIVFGLLVLGLLLMAFQSRQLPSLFDESSKIFDSTLTTVTILVMGTAILIVTATPETSPSVNYLVSIFVILSVTVNTSLRILWNQLGMIWRGETVIVSQLVLDHSKEQRNHQSMARSGQGRSGTTHTALRNTVLYDQEGILNSAVASVQQQHYQYTNSDERVTSNSAYTSHNSAITPPQDYYDVSSTTHHENDDEERRMPEEEEEPVVVDTDDRYEEEPIDDEEGEIVLIDGESSSSPPQHVSPVLAADGNEPFADESASTPGEPVSRLDVTTATTHRAMPSKGVVFSKSTRPGDVSTTSRKKNSSKRRPGHEILIELDQAPSRRLLLKMVDMQERVGRVTQRIMTGMAVSKVDWEEARSLTSRVGNMFQEEVVFGWENVHQQIIPEDASVRRLRSSPTSRVPLSSTGPLVESSARRASSTPFVVSPDDVNEDEPSQVL
uniref:G-protein coupled receptors family 3 profile domain-containing protein n=1 Tax=Entomoneis paludosa TaxID=265537 RepID=A0A7S3DMP9_9STRA